MFKYFFRNNLTYVKVEKIRKNFYQFQTNKIYDMINFILYYIKINHKPEKFQNIEFSHIRLQIYSVFRFEILNLRKGIILILYKTK